MSLNAVRYLRVRRRYCPCGARALFFSRSRRRMVWRADHTLCNRCWRATLRRERARQKFASGIGLTGEAANEVRRQAA